MVAGAKKSGPVRFISPILASIQTRRYILNDLIRLTGPYSAALDEVLPPLPSHDRRVDSDILDACCCPITQEVMRDPVLALPSGITYERAALMKWLQLRPTCPASGLALRPAEVAPNRCIQAVIEKRFSHLVPPAPEPTRGDAKQFALRALREGNLARYKELWRQTQAHH